jgi:rhodanese-related sulfurtransferase
MALVILVAASCARGIAPRQRAHGWRPRANRRRLATLNTVSTAAGASEIDVDPQQLEDWLRDDAELQVIDVREQYERTAGHIVGTRHIPLMELSAHAGTIDKGGAVVFYCRVGSRSEMAAKAFRASGFRAYNMSGGLVRWVQEGRPIEPEGGYVADH